MQKETRKTLPAIRAVDAFLKLTADLADEEIEEALRKLGVATGTWGLLWGLDNISRSGMDEDLYELKTEVLQFMQKLRGDRRWVTAVVATVPLIVTMADSRGGEYSP